MLRASLSGGLLTVKRVFLVNGIGEDDGATLSIDQFARWRHRQNGFASSLPFLPNQAFSLRMCLSGRTGLAVSFATGTSGTLFF